MWRLVATGVTLRNGLYRPETLWNGMKHIAGVEYYSTAEVAEAANISRQTLWRWRREGAVPDGHRFRNHRVLFSRREYEEILSYANRIESPSMNRDQLAMNLHQQR